MKTFTALGSLTVLVCLLANPVSADLATGLDGYWTFDETNGGILHDSSGHGYNGTVMNYPGGQGTWTSGQLGGALQFGGPSTRQYVRVPNFAMPSNAITLTAWVRASSLPRWAAIAANWNGSWGAFNYATFGPTPNMMSLYVADANVQGGINVDYGVSTASLPLNQWHFVAFVANNQNQTVTFMQDGLIKGGFHYAGKLLASSSILNIGADPSDTSPGQGNWDGKIDDLAIWTRPLSFQELAGIYNAGLAGRSLSSQLAPTITCLDYQTVECGSEATVTVLVGDPLGVALTVVWTVEGVAIQTNTVPAGTTPTTTNVSFTAELPLGTQIVEATVMDGFGNVAACSTVVAVVDTIAPVIVSASASPESLRPPNHKMVTVTVNASVTDGCGATGWQIINVQSSQPVLGDGSGNTAADWRIVSDDTVELRAERSGGSPRIYTITIQAEDVSGNLSVPKTVDVRVP